MKDMILFPEDIDRLNSVLSQLVSKANLLLGVLINKDGRLLTSLGSLEVVDTVSMAALVAGNSASTLAIANLMGETEFSTMYHQGKDKHIYISSVDENTFLALVFDDRTNIDRVKVFARQFDRQIKSSLEQVYNKNEEDINLDLGMDMANQSTYDSQIIQEEPANNHSEQQNYYPQSQSPMEIQPPPAANGDFNKTPLESDVFYIEPQKGSTHIPTPQDTSYLYFKNKVNETKKRIEE